MDSCSMLEQLPFTVVEVITKYCSPQEMAICCAVSSQMRDLFGENLLWKRRCTRGLAEYLRNTPCRVEPGFVSPEPEESTLSPISPARLDFMIENHLWNNWRLGRHVRQEITKEAEMFNRFSIFDRFLSNDHVMSDMDHPKRIEIFDVRQNVIQDLTNPIPVHEPYDCIHVLKNRVCLVRNECVKVYDLNVETKQSSIEHVFFFNRAVKEQSWNCMASAASFDKSKSLLSGPLLVAVKEGDATLHIWNIETGLKISKQECPVPRGVIEQIKEANSKLILNVTDSLQTSNKMHTFLVYNVNELAYQPFKLNLRKPFEYEVSGEYLAIVSNSFLTVFNYNTSEIFMNNINIGRNNLTRFKDVFIFMEHNEIKVCDPGSRQVIKVPMIDKVHNFQVLSDRFLQVVGYHRYELGIWEFPSLTRPRKTRTLLGFEACPYFLNKANTRYIVRYGSHGTLIHFW